MWLKVLRGNDQGDFDENDESTYGVPATYEPIDAATLGENQSDYIGHFEWKGMHLICDRFRLQFITKEKRGMVIQGVFANIPSKKQEQNTPPQGGQ